MVDKKTKRYCKNCVYYEKSVNLEPCISCKKIVTVTMTNRQFPWDNIVPMLFDYGKKLA